MLRTKKELKVRRERPGWSAMTSGLKLKMFRLHGGPVFPEMLSGNAQTLSDNIESLGT